MKTPRKRYQTDADVLKAIDKAYVDRETLKLRAAALQDEKVPHDALDYRDTKKWFQHNNAKTIPNMGFRNRVAEKLWKRANGMEDGVLKKLKGKLREIRTTEMFDGDGSIPR